MRLLKTTTLELVDAEALKWPPYVILSHRWGHQEATLQHLSQTTPDGKIAAHISYMEGYQKIRNFCYLAAHDGFEFAWIDTCCIDKTSSAELSEAINSMYKWYRKAQLCYAYLNDVEWQQKGDSNLNDEFFETLSDSQWWRRGWTLQELIAPTRVHFFSRTWTLIGDKVSLGPAITIITGIDQATLEGEDIRKVSVARRMFWASQRTTSKVEDLAYCLLGIFDVNMPLLYGEGEQAFVRLQEEVLKVSDDQSIFAWEDQCSDEDAVLFERNGTLLRGPLARSPAEFSNARDIVPYRQQQASQPYAITNYGLRMHMPLHRLRNSGGHTPVFLAELTCHFEGDFSGSLGIYVRPIKSDQYARDHGRTAPVVIDVATHCAPILATIFLRRDPLLPSREDFDRHHGVLVRLHSPEHGFDVAHVFPQDRWMRIKGRAAIILDPGQYSAVAFKRGDGVSFTVLMSHGQSNKLYESYGYDTWEVGQSRCRIFVHDSGVGPFVENSLRSLEFPLKYEGARSEHFEPFLGGCKGKTHQELPNCQILVAEMKRETIMGERMIVVDLNIYEENTGLHLLPGISSAPKGNRGQLRETLPQMMQEVSSEPLSAIPNGATPMSTAPLRYHSTPTYGSPLQGYQVSMPAGMGFLLVPQGPMTVQPAAHLQDPLMAQESNVRSPTSPCYMTPFY
jgi:hypothetical protein